MHDESAKGKPGLKAAAWVFVAFLLVLASLYLAMQLFSILHHTYKTETAITYTMADSVTLNGVAVFDVIDVAGSGDLGYLATDGERVTGGTILAESYTDASQGVLRERLDRLDRTIALLTKSQNSTGSDLSVLTTQTKTALYNLLDQLDTAAYGATADAEDAFLLAQNRMQVSTGQAEGFDATLAALQTQHDEVAGQLGELSQVTAETNGYFISATAALPLSLDRDALAAAAPAELQALLAGGFSSNESGLAGRIVTGFSWQFYATCDLDTAERFTDDLKSVKISVPGKQNDPLTATIVDVQSDEDTGTAKIVLQCQSINANVLRLGQENARIDLQTYEGIRIDRTALHIVNGAYGVYVKYGNLQRFRKITRLYENENYILVPADGALGTENEVRLYDEIIVEGTNLQDGKLL